MTERQRYRTWGSAREGRAALPAAVDDGTDDHCCPPLHADRMAAPHTTAGPTTLAPFPIQPRPWQPLWPPCCCGARMWWMWWWGVMRDGEWRLWRATRRRRMSGCAGHRDCRAGAGWGWAAWTWPRTGSSAGPPAARTGQALGISQVWRAFCLVALYVCDPFYLYKVILVKLGYAFIKSKGNSGNKQLNKPHIMTIRVGFLCNIYFSWSILKFKRQVKARYQKWQGNIKNGLKSVQYR